ncbi:MAG: isoprenylcysteine carboxylmethyltransferase family protein [Thermodesulfovibrionales bacterium]
MISRDMRGRAAGILLFASFLAFHLSSLAGGWKALDLPARLNGLLISLTILLFVSAYFLRTKAVRRPNGAAETWYPLFCAALPLVIYHDGEAVRAFAPGLLSHEAVRSVFGASSAPFLKWNVFSMALVLTGNCITLAGILYLKRSFSIMVEARVPVFDGPYRYVRHPLYLGEALATLGVLVFRFSPLNVFLFALFLWCQTVRARFEERKLTAAFPEYGDYRKRTGAFFPKR